MKNLLRKITALSAVQMLLLTTGAFAQEVIKQDNVVIGKPSTSADKVLKFDTNDGALNPKLSVEKTSKKLKYDQNQFQLGGALTTDNKEFIFNGDNKSLLYDGTSKDLRYTGEALSIGGGTNTDKALKFNNGATPPQIKYNSTTSKLQFSNNAVDFKDIGSGSGSGSTGVNLLENDSFEDPLTTGWISSGGTFSQQTYTNSVESDTKFARYITSGAGQYIESSAVLITDSMTGGCQADFKKYNTVTVSAFKVQAISGASTVLAEQTLASGSWIKAPTISFACPVAGTSVKLRLISLLAGTIEVDKGYIGSNQNLVYTSQAKILGGLRWLTTAGCIWSRSGLLGSFTSNASCDDNSRISTGSTTSITTAGNAEGQLPQIKFANMPAGDYEIVAIGSFNDQGTSNSSQWRFIDSNGVSTATSTIYGASDHRSPVIIGRFSYGVTQSNITWSIQASGGVENAQIQATEDFEIYVKFFPASSDIAISPEQSSWFLDLNIGGAVATGSATTSYIPFEHASFDMVLNTGSASAEIPCSGTNPSTGLICSSGNEQVGVAFTPPYTGTFEACIQTAIYNNGTGNSAVQWIETANNSQTIISEGKARTAFLGIDNFSNAINNCGTFTFNDISKKTLRFAYESGAANLQLYADRNGTFGQRDIKITVRPVLSAYNRPILTGDQVTTPNTTKPKLFNAVVTTTTGVVSNNFGGIISSCTAANPTVCTFTGLTGIPNCVASTASGASAASVNLSAISSSGVTAVTFLTETNVVVPNYPFTLMCFGQ